MTPHGWVVAEVRNPETLWRRPGKTSDHSATTNHQGSDLFYVFSTSTIFKAGRGYNKFSVYAQLNHGGDFHAAARALAAQGYGTPLPTIDDVELDHTTTPATDTPKVVIPWRTAREVCSAAPAEPTLIVAPYFHAGTTTKIDAPPKKGKTTLRNYFISCALHGHECVGYPAGDPTPVVTLTEEPEAVFVEGLRAAGLDARDDLHFVNLYDLRLVKWPAAIRAARLKAREVGARMVWIDTLPALARIAGEGENQAGTSLAVMEPLAELTADGLAVGLTFHERKSGGELGESGRGSSAFAGAVDTIVQMKGAKGLRDTCRELHAIGRFQGVPRLLTVELVSESQLPTPQIRRGGNHPGFRHSCGWTRPTCPEMTRPPASWRRSRPTWMAR